jgi:VWFA-related protein
MPVYPLKTSAKKKLARWATLVTCTLVVITWVPDAASRTGKAAPPNRKDLTLNVAALDVNGHAVTNLTSTDFKIFDNGKLQHITSFKPGEAQSVTENPPPSTIILFDLLNGVPERREYESQILIRTLEPLGAANSVYLYLLTNHGDLYPVGGPAALPSVSRLPPAENADADEKPMSAPWTRQIHSLLDRAIQKEYGFRPIDDTDTGVRAEVTFRALSELAQHSRDIPGRKTIVWITRGVPNWVDYPYGCHDVTFTQGSGSYLAGECSGNCRRLRGKCIDYEPFLRRFSNRLDRTGTSIYSVKENEGSSLPSTDRGTAEDTLHLLADLTGAPMYSDGQTEKAIVRSLEKAPARYQLGYEMPPPDSKYHKLRVVCARKGVKIESRRGYFADQP